LKEEGTSPKFYFLFDQNNTFTRSKIVHLLGEHEFDALLPLESKVFTDEDWYINTEKCQNVDDYVLEDSGNFASFMYSLVINLLGGEDKIFDLIGIPRTLFSKYDGSMFEDDEDFDE